MIHLFAPVWAHFHASLPVEDEPPAANGNRLKRKARDRPADA